MPAAQSGHAAARLLQKSNGYIPDCVYKDLQLCLSKKYDSFWYQVRQSDATWLRFTLAEVGVDHPYLLKLVYGGIGDDR